jgi:hypothetical protein
MSTFDIRDRRLPTALIWLLVYQWILVLVALYFCCVFLSIMVFGPEVDAADTALGCLEFLAVGSWGTAMGIASVGIARRSPRGFLVGMICHLLIEIPGVPIMLAFFAISLASRLEPLFLVFGLMWLPFVLISAWAFFYLRRLRKQLPS